MGITRYIDSNYDSDIEDRKLITKYCFFFGGSVFSLCNKRQRSVSMFVSKAKYVVISHRAREGI